MGLKVDGVGVISVVCSNCGFKIYWYAIGDSNNRSKFSGPPTPFKAISGYDGGLCPMCNHRLSRKPLKLIFMSQKEFNEKYVVGEFKLVLRRALPHMDSFHVYNVSGLEARSAEPHVVEA